MAARKFDKEYRLLSIERLTQLWQATIFRTMDGKDAQNARGMEGSGKHETIGGVLAAALNMEDDISEGVYEDYLDRSRWPKQLDDEVFIEIEKRLNVLIQGVVKHKKILKALVEQYG